METRVKVSYGVFLKSFFQVFNYDFTAYTYFAHIAVSSPVIAFMSTSHY